MNGAQTASVGNEFFRYWAFISYSSKDKNWARWLHRSIETYGIPAQFVSHPTPAGQPAPKRFQPLFHDRSELPASADLGAVIEEALRASRYLIVVCSPSAAKSRWVNKEIETFQRLHGTGRILAVIVGGEPNQGEEDECFPPALRLVEPIAADARAEADGRNNAKLKLLAGMLGVSFDTLKQRDTKRKIRRLQLALATSLLVVAGFASLAWYASLQRMVAIQQRNIAEQRKQEALQTLSRSDFLRAVRLVNEHNINDALACLARSLSAFPGNSAAAELAANLLTYRSWVVPSLSKTQSAEIRSLQLSDDCKHMAVILTNSRVMLWDMRTAQVQTKALECTNSISFLSFSTDGKQIVTASGAVAQVWSVESGKPLTPVMKHNAPIISAQFSPDATQIVTLESGGIDPWATNDARLWNAATGELVARPMMHNGRIESVEFSEDGSRILTVWGYILVVSTNGATSPSNNGGVNVSGGTSLGYFLIGTNQYSGPGLSAARVWDTKTGAPLTGLLGHGGTLRAAQISPDGKSVLAMEMVSGGNVLRVWDVQAGQERHFQSGEHFQSGDINSPASPVLFTPDGRRIIAVSGTEVQLLDVATGQSATPPLKHDGKINSARLSPDGKRIVTASDDQTARIWDLESGRPLLAPLMHDEPVHFARFSPDGKEIVTVTARNSVRLFDAETGEALTTILNVDGRVDDAYFISETRQIVTTGADFLVWKTLNRPPPAIRLEMPDRLLVSRIDAAAFTKDGKNIVTASWKSRRVTVSDSTSGRQLFGFSFGKPGDTVQSAQLSDDGTRIFALLWTPPRLDFTAELWDAERGKPLIQAPLKGNIQWAFLGGSRAVVPTDSEIRVWDSRSGSQLPSISNIKGTTAEFSLQANSETISADGTKLATATGQLIELYDLQRGKVLTEFYLNADSLATVRLSPDGNRLLVIADNQANVYDADNGRALIGPLRHNGTVNSGEFSPDGRFILTTSSDNMVRVWDVENGDLLANPLKFSASVQSAHFSEDGKQIVTAADDVMQVWDEQNGQFVSDALGTGGSLRSAQLDQGRRRVLSISADVEARVWDLGPAKTPAPDWFVYLMEAVSGRMFDKQSVLEFSSIDRASVVAQIRLRLKQESNDNDWVKWGRWFLDDLSTRTVSPYARVTVREYVDELIEDNTTQSLNEARQLAFGDAELEDHIAIAHRTPLPKSFSSAINATNPIAPPTLLHVK